MEEYLKSNVKFLDWNNLPVFQHRILSITSFFKNVVQSHSSCLLLFAVCITKEKGFDHHYT